METIACPTGLLWNDEIDVCDWPTNVVCGNGTGQAEATSTDHMTTHTTTLLPMTTTMLVSTTSTSLQYDITDLLLNKNLQIEDFENYGCSTNSLTDQYRRRGKPVDSVDKLLHKRHLCILCAEAKYGQFQPYDYNFADSSCGLSIKICRYKYHAGTMFERYWNRFVPF